MFCCCIGNYKGTTNQSTRKQLEFTGHLTPLSPWRGVGGEADCGWGMGLYLIIHKASHSPLPLERGRGEAECGRGEGEWLRLYLLFRHIFEGEGCCTFAHNLVFGRYIDAVFQVDYHLIITRALGNVETTRSISRVGMRGVEGCAGQSQ